MNSKRLPDLIFATVLVALMVLLIICLYRLRRPRVQVYRIGSHVMEVLQRTLEDASMRPVMSVTRPSTASLDITQYDGSWVRGWTGDVGWINYGFVYMGKPLPIASQRHPELYIAIGTMFNLSKVSMCGFSTLRAGACIPTHTDENFGCYPGGWGAHNNVVHIGVVVPPSTCGLRVGNKVIQEEKSRAIAFCDSVPHSAWNDSAKQDRTVLYIKTVN